MAKEGSTLKRKKSKVKNIEKDPQNDENSTRSGCKRTLISEYSDIEDSQTKKHKKSLNKDAEYADLKMDRRTLAKFRNKVPGFLELLKSKPIVSEPVEEKQPVTEEMIAKMKMRKEKNDRMRKKKLARKMAAATGQPPSDRKQKSALSYLMGWAQNRETWTFQKVRQTWLLQNMYDPVMIPDKQFELVLEYMVDLKGSSAEKTIKEAESVLSKAEESIGFDSEEKNDGSSSEQDNEEEEIKHKKKKKKKKPTLEDDSDNSGDDNDDDTTIRKHKKKNKKKKPALVGDNDSSGDEKDAEAGIRKHKKKKKKPTLEDDNDSNGDENDDEARIQKDKKKKKKKKSTLADDNDSSDDEKDNEARIKKLKKKKKNKPTLADDNDSSDDEKDRKHRSKKDNDNKCIASESDIKLNNNENVDKDDKVFMRYQRARRLLQILRN